MGEQKQDRDTRLATDEQGRWRAPSGAEAFSRAALVGSSAVFLVTALAWGTAKGACNYHPTPASSFTTAGFEERTATAKGSALEFHHRLVIGDFERAHELAEDAGARLVDEARARCHPCDPLRSERRGTVTRAEVWQQTDAGVFATALSVGPPGLHEEASYRLVQRNGRWRVVGTEPD